MDALCRIVQNWLHYSKLRALFPELTGKRCISFCIYIHSPTYQNMSEAVYTLHSLHVRLTCQYGTHDLFREGSRQHRPCHHSWPLCFVAFPRNYPLCLEALHDMDICACHVLHVRPTCSCRTRDVYCGRSHDHLDWLHQLWPSSLQYFSTRDMVYGSHVARAPHVHISISTLFRILGVPPSESRWNSAYGGTKFGYGYFQ